MSDNLRDALEKLVQEWHGSEPTEALYDALSELLAAHAVEPAPGVSDEAVEAFSEAYLLEVLSRVSTASLPSDAAVRAGLEATLPFLQAEPECGAVDRTGQRRCVFTPGHHEAENWTSHGDRGGWTWNDQPAEV